ncbi:MAG: HD domain-containing protein [Pelolinea sp.]|nr:HD domain-containing protein [Pelolinea sp.]
MINTSAWSQEKYIHAIHFAARAHKGQFFEGTDLPYLLHLSMVSSEVIAALSVEHVNSPDLAVQCALLHDTIENAGITFDNIMDEFGEEVANGVLALTKDKTLSKCHYLSAVR